MTSLTTLVRRLVTTDGTAVGSAMMLVRSVAMLVTMSVGSAMMLVRVDKIPLASRAAKSMTIRR